MVTSRVWQNPCVVTGGVTITVGMNLSRFSGKVFVGPLHDICYSGLGLAFEWGPDLLDYGRCGVDNVVSRLTSFNACVVDESLICNERRHSSVSLWQRCTGAILRPNFGGSMVGNASKTGDRKSLS